MTIALRTQQVLAYESGVTAKVDPFGGSYFVERLTCEIEEAANDYIRRIDGMGGMIPAIEKGFPQTEIAQASYEYQKAVETSERKVVGVNAYTEEGGEPIELLEMDETAERRQVERLERVKGRRKSEDVARALAGLREAARSEDNTMPYILDAARAYATVGEICGALGEVFGAYREVSIL